LDGGSQSRTAVRAHTGSAIACAGNSEAGYVSGKIVKVHTKNIDYKGYTHHATQATAVDPRHEISSDKSDHVALHKGAGAAQDGLMPASACSAQCEDRSFNASARGVCRPARRSPHPGSRRRAPIRRFAEISAVWQGSACSGVGRQGDRSSLAAGTWWSPACFARFAEHSMAQRLLSRLRRLHVERGIRSRPGPAVDAGEQSAHRNSVRRRFGGAVIAR
jgi:hypothetical protein